MFSNLIKTTFILILFYQSPVQSKVKDINKFDHKDLSNYFSGLISFNQNKNTEALNFFNSAKILKDKHTPYLESYIKILVQEKPDILHLRSRFPGWIGYLAWKKIPFNNRPTLITTVHGRYSVSKYSAIMMRGEKVIAVSEMIRKYIIDNYSII